MAQELIEIDEARRRVLGRCAPLADETVRIERALGRALAEDVTSANDVPSFDTSAMDGFALRAADTHGASGATPVRLRVVDESRAGVPAGRDVGPGEAIAIATGAMLPAGADSVVRIEDITNGTGEAEIQIEADVEPGRSVRRAGEDVRAGDSVLAAGTALGPAELGVLASVARESIRCTRRPRVAVVTTGDELLDASERMRPGGVRNTNAYSVPALIELAGGDLAMLEVATDDPATVRRRVEAALEADVAVVTGGLSVGRHDHVRPAFEQLGIEEEFWGLALRPGKPTWFGVAPTRALVFGLPGNPVSTMVTFTLLVRPALLALAGMTPDRERTTAVLDERYEKSPGRAHAVRVILEARSDGWHARPTGEQGSHVMTSMLGADALAVIPPDRGDVEAAEHVAVEFLPRVTLAP